MTAPYTDYNFSFPDQATQQSVLPLESLVNIDVLGFVTNQDGTLNTSNWLVNVRLLDSESLTTQQRNYIIAPPLYPKRVWEDVSGGTLSQS